MAMKVFTGYRKADSHPNHNEDNYYVTTIGEFAVGAVFDGCSGGKDSYFASKLMANLFRQTIHTFYQFRKPFDPQRMIDMDIAFQFLVMANSMREARSVLALETYEMESTMVYFYYHIPTKRLWVRFLGDGFLTYRQSGETDWQAYFADQDNKPQYMVHYIDYTTEFAKYFRDVPSFYLENVEDFTVATDGIKQIRVPNIIPRSPDDDLELLRKIGLDPVSYLVSDTSKIQSTAMLSQKINQLTNLVYAQFRDDLTLIRVINLPDPNEAIQQTEAASTGPLESQGTQPGRGGDDLPASEQ